MKKIIPVILAVLLVVGMCTVSVSAFTIGKTDGIPAVSAETPIGSSNADVNISASGATVNVYAVDITFGNMSFSYGTETKWNPNTHKYEVVDGGTPVWSPVGTGTPNIVIDNHSDLPINYAIEASDENQTTYGAKVQFDGQDTASGTIAKCPVEAVDVPSATVTVSVVAEGTVQNITTDPVKLATVTVTITKSA